MQLRLATPDEIDHWDEHILQNPDGGNVFQTKAFLSTKADHGWKPRFCVYESTTPTYCAYITRRVQPLGELWYAPKGPGVTSSSDLANCIDANHGFAQKFVNIFAFKIEPGVLKASGYPQELIKVHDIQPNANTVIVDLTPTENDLLASFRQRARRAIRQAQKDGVTATAVEPTEENLRTMYDLYKATGDRAGFHVRDFSYHKQLWLAWIGAHQGQLFFASDHGTVTAAVFIAYHGSNGLYKDGASDRGALKNGTAHLLQWEVMRWLKAHGVTSYDLHGTPPASELDNPTHRAYGLGIFKTSFKAEPTEFVGTLDQIIKPRSYALWRRLGERASQSLEYRLRGRTFY